MEKVNEVYLIRRVKEKQDMKALHELLDRYRPLINGAKLAQKRTAFTKSISYDNVVQKNLIKEEVEEMHITPRKEMYQKFIKKLSDKEVIALKVFLGELTIEEASQKTKYSRYQLLQAKARCKAKMQKELF